MKPHRKMGHVTVTGADIDAVQRDVLKLRAVLKVCVSNPTDFWVTWSTQPPVALAALAGGYSGEAEVSRKSAAMVLAHMDRGLFAPVQIDVDGWWCERPSDGLRVPVDPTFSFAMDNGERWA